MTKANIKKEIDSIYSEVIDHKGLPSAYRVGMTIFKNRVVNFISSNAMLAVTSDSEENNKESEVAVAFEKWKKKNRNRLDFSRTNKSLFAQFSKATER